MSYENVPCASPDTERDEEPAPSLYGIETADENLQLAKKRIEPIVPPSRLAETANIEDHLIMNEEEIAQATRVNRKDFESEGKEKREEESIPRSEDDRNSYGSLPPRARWRRWGEYETQPNENTNAAEVPTCEFSERNDRSDSVIKHAHDAKEEESTRGKISLDREDYMSLQCNENISRDDGGAARSNVDRSRGGVYYYHRDEASGKSMVSRDGDGYESDTDRSRKAPETDSQKPQDQHAVPQAYHMHYPNIMTLSQAGGMVGAQALAGMPAHLLREHLMRMHFAGDGRQPSQRGDYASSRPEQQVPVASSPGDSAESVYNALPRHAQPVNTGIQYVDRQGLVQQGFAVIPGIGPVQVSMDGNGGVYYSAIPMGATDPSRYDNFTSIQAFNKMQAENQARLQTQRPSAGTTVSTSEQQQPHHSKESTQNAAKSYTSSMHTNAVLSPTSSEELRSTASPSHQSGSSSPTPTSQDESSDKKILQAKAKGRPRPYGSRPEIKCEQCGKIFGSSSALAKHKLTHSDERRYVCSICSKGFKRQDHLNGHMVTHRDKKPYECSYADCDKSYCDMRSLRRHLENHHAANQAASGSGSSNGSRTASPAPPVEKPAGNTVSAVTVVPAIGHMESSTNKMVVKPGRGRPPKERGLNIEGTDSGRSTPCSTGEPGHDQGNKLSKRERSSDSCSSDGSDGPPNKLAAAEPKPHTAMAMLKQAAERVQEQRKQHALVEQQQQRFSQHPYMVLHDGLAYPPQLYAAQVYPGQDPRFGVYPYPQMFAQQVYQLSNGQGVVIGGQDLQRQQLASRLQAEVERQNELAKQKAQMQGQQSAQPSPMQEYPSPNDNRPDGLYRQKIATSGTPTDATAIALATAKDTAQHLYSRESYFGVHPSGTQWQPVRYDETIQHSTSDMGNVKTCHSQSPDSGTSSDVEDRYPRGVHFAASVRPDNIDIPRKPREFSQQGGNHSQTDIKHSREHRNDSDKDNSVFRNPSDIVSPRRKRPRPEPLKIPPSVSTAYNSPASPHGRNRTCSPPYTPPPMLSPRSIFSHVNAAGNLTPRSGVPPMPMTPSRLMLSARRLSSNDVDDELTFPEPKINIGPQFQASIPDVIAPKENARHDDHKATLVWYPVDERKRGRREEIEAFLDMACSVAVVGGGSNKEYALHILHKAGGNLKEAVRLLLSKKHVTSPSDPMYNYHYEGSVKWASKERQTFRNSFRLKGKDFNDLKKEIGETKTVGDCVEFYYLWKATHPEAVRGRTRYVDSDSEEEYEEEDTGSETNSNPSLFECDFPDCSAKFVSRQALNGHIRVHGGSFMKPSEPRKRRAPPPTLDLDHVVVKRRKPHVPAPPPMPLVEGGPLPEFACKVCGRIFHKIKSRSAHMKTHVKRPDDDDKNSIHRQ
ncbi:uncharacterized protein LOC5518889 [Nematostella vectensis]|nr:uncharacterized protein LOC5518889 [Nematostella vectensis]XP_048586108.1 uncharacterized protein LOC5518889 [Nematostella vectensis]XP_048586109.1 uncharacterized protein LOC5518889 [Nematostella vectensis]